MKLLPLCQQVSLYVTLVESQKPVPARRNGPFFLWGESSPVVIKSHSDRFPVDQKTLKSDRVAWNTIHLPIPLPPYHLTTDRAYTLVPHRPPYHLTSLSQTSLPPYHLTT